MKQPLDMILDNVEWVVIPRDKPEPEDGTLYATHEGTVKLAGFLLKCYQLNNGQRVFDAEDFEQFWAERTSAL